MINPQELRLGNLLHLYKENNLVEVIKIFEAHLEVHSVDLQFWTEEINEFNPIPLTEEILLKCGFKQTKNLVGVRASYTFREVRVSLSNSGHWYFKQRIIYLHDLQNIVFALYGKELEVKI